jgi:hypothetical protein
MAVEQLVQAGVIEAYRVGPGRARDDMIGTRGVASGKAAEAGSQVRCGTERTGATGLDPATSGVTGHFDRGDG